MNNRIKSRKRQSTPIELAKINKSAGPLFTWAWKTTRFFHSQGKTRAQTNRLSQTLARFTFLMLFGLRLVGVLFASENDKLFVKFRASIKINCL